MSSWVAFSGLKGDGIRVEEDPGRVAELMTVSDVMELTIVPQQNQRFDPARAYVRVDRIAYVSALPANE